MGIERLSEFWPEWRITDKLGQGAYGTVYKAVDEEAGFPVYSAIKVLSIPASDAELDALEADGMSRAESEKYFKEIVDDFVNEIKLMHTLKGAPNIVSVEAFKIAEKTEGIGWDIFIRMELLDSFKDYAKIHSFNEDDILKLGIDLASALEVCKENNIIHRDIKPANIFADKFGNFKLGDFGIAKELEKTAGALSSKGTFSYMAPEVAKGERYDATVDIYSLGLVLYSLCNNNRPPFISADNSEVGYNDRKEAIDRRLSGEALPPPAYASAELAKIILTACAFDPQKRFKNPTAFKNALISYRDNRGNASTPAEQTADPPKTITVGHMPDSELTITQRVRMAAPEVKGQTLVPSSVSTSTFVVKKKSPIIIITTLMLITILTIIGVVAYNIKKETDSLTHSHSDISEELEKKKDELDHLHSEKNEYFENDYQIKHSHSDTELKIITASGITEDTVIPKATGKITIVNFWGTWCNPAIKELAHIDKIATDYKDRVSVIAVHTNMVSDTAPAFIKKYYSESDLIFAVDLENEDYYTEQGGNGAYPYTVILDENGAVVKTFSVAVEYEDLQEVIETELN